MTTPDAVVTCLTTTGPLTRRDLIARLVRAGGSGTKNFNQYVGKTLNRLYDQGRVGRGGDGRWSRTETAAMSAAASGAGRPDRK